MCKSCGCEGANMKIKYKCDCIENDCTCGIIGFKEEPKSTPYCCGVPMKKIK